MDSRSLPSIVQLSGCLDDFDPGAVPVQTAQQLIGQWVQPVPAIEKVALRDCLGRMLGTDVLSNINVPAHDNSAMDGWAIRSTDLDASGAARLAVASGTAWAGRPWEGSLVSPGEAVRVFTGAVMPPGCDTVVPQEWVQFDPSGAVLLVPPGQRSGQNRRLAGEDLSVGAIALAQGTRLGAAHLGLAASLGLAELPLRRRVRVAFFSTGDELRSIGDPLGPGEVYDSNRYTLWAMLRRLGVELVDLGVVRDDPVALEQALRSAAQGADAVISSGGVSVGEADFTREVMARVGEVAFWTIAMRPGRPMAVGRVGEAVYFGLPGNPVAVMVTFLFFVRDALLRMAGARPEPLLTVPVRSVHALRKRAGRTEYQRAVVSSASDGQLEARVTGQQGSGVLRSMAEANAMLVLRHEQGDIAAGDSVDALLFEGLL